jgi:hypothetical protein
MATSVDIGLGKSVDCTHAPMTDLSNSIQAPLREREGTTVLRLSRFDYGRLLPVAQGASGFFLPLKIGSNSASRSTRVTVNFTGKVVSPNIL